MTLDKLTIKELETLNVLKKMMEDAAVTHLALITPRSQANSIIFGYNYIFRPEFYFTIHSTKIENNASIAFSSSSAPASIVNNSAHSKSGDLNKTLNEFEGWIRRIKYYFDQYNRARIDHEVNSFYQKYLHIIDEDADVVPFGIKEQYIIVRALNKIQEEIGSEKLYDEVQRQITVTKSLVKSAPKATVLKGISKIGVMLSKIDDERFKTFLRVAEEMLYGSIIVEGLTGISELLKLIP